MARNDKQQDEQPEQPREGTRFGDDKPRGRGAELEQMRREARVDPRTNQPITDFFPSGLSGEDADAVAVHLGEQRLASGTARFATASQLLESRRKAVEEARLASEDLDQYTMPEGQTLISPDVYRARSLARIKAEARAAQLDRTIPGGRYRVGDEWVNARGDLIDQETGRIVEKRHREIGT